MCRVLATAAASATSARIQESEHREGGTGPEQGGGGGVFRVMAQPSGNPGKLFCGLMFFL